jgi:hypothetical protein
MKKKLLSLVAVLATAAGLTVLAPGSAGAAYCGIQWGSAAKSRTGSTSPLTNVRGGRHDCWDRLVIDFAGKTSGSNIRYVSGVPYEGRDGNIPLRGGAYIYIQILGPAYDQNGNPTYRPANGRELVNVTGYRTFRQVAWGGSFEGYTTIGLGVRARLPFRVSVLAGPGTHSRLVIDVAHLW